MRQTKEKQGSKLCLPQQDGHISSHDPLNTTIETIQKKLPQRAACNTLS